ncbi:hypothetical protein Daesc_009910 [Daldinia eschscholtzii]|uniref:Uncharacterized protein n=1 Tax=Daldinia eschscholtzii TaxID=292717 RepID=A0AAX6M6W7_9PEZI
MSGEVCQGLAPYTRGAVIRSITPILGNYFDSQDTRSYVQDASQMLFSRVPATRIRTWITHSTDNSLWIQGSAEESHPSRAMLAAVSVMVQPYPTISHFCSLGTAFPSDQAEPTSKEMLLDMIKRLIVKLVFVLPDEIFTTYDLSSSRFEILAEPEVDIRKALGLLRDIRLLSKYEEVNCVIEGVQFLEDRTDIFHIRNLRPRVLSN